MNYETVGGLQIPKIGFGTWGIGGGSSADRAKDEVSLAALRSALDLGYRHFDTAEMYAAGHSEEILGLAIRSAGVSRAELFLTSKVLPEHLHESDVLRSCNQSLRRLGTDYLDLYLIHWPNAQVRLSETFRALNALVRDGRVRRVGVSNFDLQQLKEARGLSSTPILTNQVPFSLRDRSYAENGVLAYCQENDILITAYTPFGDGGLHVTDSLTRVAHAHSATLHQIALAWLTSHPRVITIPMSLEPDHQRENFASADIALAQPEIALLSRS